jgi:glucose/arabinose dehydrogenase
VIRRAASLVALAALLAACGGGGGAGSTAGPPATSAATQATTAPAATATAPSATTAPGAATAASPLGVADLKVRPVEVVHGLDRPDWVGSPPGDDRLFVIEQHEGRIRVVRDGKLLAEPFLTLPGRVSTGDEQGLLGLAFDPGFAQNGRFVVDYTNADGTTRIVEFTAPGAGDRADPASGRVLLSIDQPYENHNGGDVVFGPDGNLWIGMGDGGSAGDPQNRAQNPDELLGKLLRIDVHHPSGGRPYGIPPTNPYANGGGEPEVVAIGLRNPWRFSFGADGRLWIGDVGQNQTEEVDRVQWSQVAGDNFGWRLFEGNHAYETGAAEPPRYVGPVATYDHVDGNCSITGGVEVRGVYVYADYCSGRFWAVSAEGGPAVEITQRMSRPVASPVSFGVANGEVYVASLDGTVYVLRLS